MGLTGNQWQFIARRLVSSTDKEAAEVVGLRPQTVSEWKRDCPEFVREYEAAFTDGVHVAQEITRQHLGRAAMVLAEGLDARQGRKPDYASRLASAKAVLQSHGLLRDRVEHTSNPDAPVRIVVEYTDSERETHSAPETA